MPAHHKLERFLDEYLDTAGIRDGGKIPLFRSALGRTGMLTERPPQLLCTKIILLCEEDNSPM
jgi:hypothetical protein